MLKGIKNRLIPMKVPGEYNQMVSPCEYLNGSVYTNRGGTLTLL